jgi:prepilin-type processing-associated H-X9-DG protein
MQGPDDLLNGGIASGLIPLLPFVEQENLKNIFDTNFPWYFKTNFEAVGTTVRLFFCPSNRTTGLLDMQAVGQFMQVTLPQIALGDYAHCKGTNAALCTRCRVPPQARGPFDVNSETRILAITDGTSNTIAMGDAAGGNSRYMARNTWDATTPSMNPQGDFNRIDGGWAPGSVASSQLVAATGGAYSSGLCVTAQRGGFTPDCDEPMNNRLLMAATQYRKGCDNSNPAIGSFDTLSGFRSLHPGGCNFVFCDGSGRFLEENITPAIYKALSTMAGGEPVTVDE